MTHNRDHAGRNKLVGALSTQLNIVLTMDVARVLRTGSLDQAVYLMDNDPRSVGKGTASLATACHPGQVINWLCNSIECQSWPPGRQMPIPRIANLVFLYEDSEIPRGDKVLADLKVYGAPDVLRSPMTPVYQYWAGTVLPEMGTGRYRYRIVFELPSSTGAPSQYFEMSSASLHVSGQGE